MSNLNIVWQYLYSCCLHSETLARLEYCVERNNHNMHIIHCTHKLHTQYLQTWTNVIIKKKSQNYGQGPKEIIITQKIYK